MTGPSAAAGPPFDATPFLHAYAWLRLPRLRGMDPARTQERLLLDLLRRAAGTRFGRAHGFGDIRDVAGFQARVPLRRYEAFWEEWWRGAWPVLAAARQTADTYGRFAERFETVAGCTVCCHCGPNTLGILFIRK